MHKQIKSFNETGFVKGFLMNKELISILEHLAVDSVLDPWLKHMMDFQNEWILPSADRYWNPGPETA